MLIGEQHVQDLVAAGDVREATAEAIRLVGSDVLHYLRFVLHDEDDVGDAFSAFAEALWRGLPGFRWEASLRTWSFRLAWNAARDLRGEAWRRHRQRLATSEASKLADEARTKTFARVERQRAELERLLETLSVEDQSLFALRIGQGLSWNEIAEVLTTEGRPVDAATAAKRFSRMKEHLGELARERGLLDDSR